MVVVVVSTSPHAALFLHWAVQIILLTFFSIAKHSISIPDSCSGTELSNYNARDEANQVIPLNASPALGDLFLSGWNCKASLR